jgi:hypothetical protein
MAIQLRRGDYADFDPSRLLDGELAIVLENDPNTEDGTGTYVSYGNDNVKRLLTADEQVEVPTATTTTAGIVKPDGTTIEVNSSGTISVPSASTSRAGLMSSSDKSKLNGIDTGATKNTASDTAPLVDGTASAGSSTDYARADHVHPTDTSRASASDLTDHVDDTTVHVTSAERTSWNGKADESDLTSHTSDTTAHVTQAERTAWDAKASTDTATMSANGLMSASDKSKLDGIGTKANGYYTTEVVNGDRVLTLVYDLVEE